MARHLRIPVAGTILDANDTEGGWRWMGPLMKVAAAFGLSARMSAAQAAESNIELIDVLSKIAADYEQIRCPVMFVVGTGKHMGAREDEMQKMRAGIDPIVASRPNVTIFATVPASHTQILPKHPDTIAAAIDAVVSQASQSGASGGGAAVNVDARSAKTKDSDAYNDGRTVDVVDVAGERRQRATTAPRSQAREPNGNRGP